MSRQRQVYKTDRIAHLWYYQTQGQARNAQGNFYFIGDTIYSYGSHFPIARKGIHRGRPYVMFTELTYGPTTAKHLGSVRRAIPSGGMAADAKVFNCPGEPSIKPCDLLMRYKLEHKRRLAEVASARKGISRMKRYERLLEFIDAANEFCEFFSYTTRFDEPKNADELAAERNRVLVNATRRRPEQEEKREKENAENRRLWAMQMVDVIAQWRKGGRMPPGMAYRLPGLLRVVGDVIETSQGVEFPLSHAVRAMPLVEGILAMGEEWHSNGHRIPLGHYAVDSIDADGTLKAGCHVIARDELLLLIAELKGRVTV